jgi:hypothetical protein
MTIGTCPLSWSLLGVKRTWPIAPHMSANDPKRTLLMDRHALKHARKLIVPGQSGVQMSWPKRR